jgi:membrane-associated phospholipid phosphatase
MLTKAALCLAITLPALRIAAQAQTIGEQQDTSSIASDQTPGSAAQPDTDASRSAGQDQKPIEDARDRIYYPGDTEHLKPLGVKLFKNILLDQKELWTSPFRMKKKDLGWWIGIPAITAALIVTDNKTIDTFENSKGQITWGNHISNIGASYTLIPLVAGFYGYGVWKDQPKAREVGVLGAQALLDSLIIVEVLKPIAGRNRPNSTEKAGDFFQGGASFPSGHSIESWALASVIAHEYQHTKVVPIVVYSLATVVSLSRFAGQQHFASDIFFGGAMGWFIGRYVYQTHVNHAIHKHGWLRPQIIPKFDPGQRTYGVTLAFGN